MGTNNVKSVWVGVLGGLVAGYFDVHVSTGLKGLCEDLGVSYATAKSKVKGGDGPVTLYSGDGVEERAWTVKRVKVKRVKGRGRALG